MNRFVRAAVPPATCILALNGTYNTTTDCGAASQCGWKYKSDASGACFLAADGTYATQDECLKASMKWKCNGTGQCVQDPTGTFATLGDCKCYTCDNNTCAAVAAGVTTGTYGSVTECENDAVKKCGWKYGCASVDAGADPANMCMAYPPSSPLGKYASSSACKCVSAVGSAGPDCQCTYDSTVTGDAAFSTVAQCQADTTAQCGWKYGCSPPVTLKMAGGSKALPRAGWPTYPNMAEPQLQYVPVGTAFIAYKPFATVSGSQVSLEIGSGGGYDGAGMDVVLVPTGNYAVDKMDPNTTNSKWCQYTEGVAQYYSSFGYIQVGNETICRADPTNPQKVGGDVYFFTGHKRNYNTTSGQGTALNGKTAVKVGYQYQVYVRVYNSTDDQVTAYWNEMTVTLSDT